MPTDIVILIDGRPFEAELFDTPAATEILRVLPIDAAPEEWGDELYFAVPVALPPDETATTLVDPGDIGYWPPGRALAIFFGPTPLSTDDRPVPAGAVNLVGRLTCDPASLRGARGARQIRVARR